MLNNQSDLVSKITLGDFRSLWATLNPVDADFRLRKSLALLALAKDA
jgi:hypothetical protein